MAKFKAKWDAKDREWRVYDGFFILGRGPDCGAVIDMVLNTLRILQQAMSN